MSPTLVQVSNASGVFPSPVTVGNTIILDVAEFSAPTITVTAVELGGTTVAGTTQLAFPQTGGGGSPQGVCVVMLPNVQVSGQTAVTYTCSGSVIGTYAEEWAGLGPNPTMDVVQTATGATGTILSGTSGATTQAAELIHAAAATFNGTTSSPTGSSWTATTGLGSNHLSVGHIIQSASGQTYSWSQAVGGTTGWAVAIVAIYAGAGGVTVPASWSGSYAVPSGNTFPFPSARPVQVSVANAPGDWMAAIVTWRQAVAGETVTVSIADDAHNWWEPLGAPSGDSSAAGVTRCAVWVAPAARAAGWVQVAASGPYQALAVRILDVNGMQPWMTMTPVVTSFANAATSLSLSAAAPSASAFLVAAAGSDDNADTVTGPGAGWTSLSAVTASNGVDHTADITLSCAWQVTSASAAAAWSSTGALDFSGVIAGVLVSGTPPVQPNPNWPVVITEIAPGSGAQTLPAALSWTPLSARALSLSVQQGKQYTLSQLQAGQGALVADNPDGALIPPGTGAFAGIDSGTPVRQRVIIPQLASPYYTAFSGYMQRWPWAAPGDMLRGETQATLVDVWAYAAGLLNSMAREECLIDGPHSVWPLDDPAGSLQGSNIAPGNSLPLTLVESKYGAGGATAAFGANSGALIGDTSASLDTGGGQAGGSEGMFSQALAGTALANNGYGYALVCADPAYPPLSAGVTVECFFQSLLAGGGAFPFTAVVSGNNFTAPAASFAGQQPVTLSGGSLPGGFSAGTVYYTGGVSGSTFQLALTPGGAAVTVTSAGSGTITTTTAWNPVILSARNARGVVAELHVRNTDGVLVLAYQTAAGAGTSVVADGAHDYRNLGSLVHVSLALTQTTWRLLVDGGGIATASGTFAAALAAQFAELDFGGIQDRGAQGWALPGYTALAAVYPSFLAPSRVLNHFWAAGAGMAGEAACDRVERVLEYAGLTGRRWLGQQVVTYEGDLLASGQDVGGQGAATSAVNVAASTAPANLYVAPTGDIVYWSKLYSWNQPAKWTLGDNTAGGEIPFTIGQFSTDYDPARVVNDIQLTQLDTQTVTVPSGVTASTTLAAIEAASSAQYGDQAYQQTGYLQADATSPYSAGGSMVDLANWIADVYRKPANRVQAVTVNAAANAANASSALAWQFWAGASVGDMVQVNVRLPTAATSPLFSVIARISQTTRGGQFSQDGSSATLTCVLDFAPEATALICDDPVRGLLNGSNYLAWLRATAGCAG